MKRKILLIIGIIWTLSFMIFLLFLWDDTVYNLTPYEQIYVELDNGEYIYGVSKISRSNHFSLVTIEGYHTEFDKIISVTYRFSEIKSIKSRNHFNFIWEISEWGKP